MSSQELRDVVDTLNAKGLRVRALLEEVLPEEAQQALQKANRSS